MALGIGMRTIWISLRAVNYTDRAFRSAIGNLDKLSDKEKEHLKNMLKMQRVARLNIQVGMLYAAMAGMAAQQLFGLLALTERGSAYMSEFNQVLDETKVALADTFFEAMRPILDVVKTFLELIRDNAALRWMIVLLAAVAIAGIFLYGVIKILTGIYGGIQLAREINAFLIKHELILNKQLVLSNQGLTASTITLGQALMFVAISASAAFGLFLALKDTIGPLPAAFLAIAVATGIMAVQLWLAAGAMSVLTWGLAAIAGGAAIAGAIAALSTIKSFQLGTRSAPYTGLAMVHKGEVIYNPSTDRPTGLGPAGEERTSVTHQKVDINIENLNTDTPYDEVESKIGRTLRRNMRDSR